MRLTRRLFLAALGLVGLVAVGAYAWQFDGLAGPDGIAPLADGMEGLRRGGLGPLDVPTLLWISSSTAFIKALLSLSCAACLCLLFGLAPRWACFVLWACWGSIVQVGHPFLAFQWDLLLTETAFCAFFLAPGGLRPHHSLEPEPHVAWRWLFAVLACKVTLESGLVKLLGGDPTWRDLTALTWHWWTQPLPTWTSVAMSRLPLVVQQAMCAGMFVFELLIPLLVFLPRRPRLVGAVGMIALQIALSATGNFSFYNVLTLLLSIPLLDDRFLQAVSPTAPVRERGPHSRGAWQWVVVVVFAGISGVQFLARGVDSRVLEFISRFDSINAYGAFARMTKNRAEIVLEGSRDGATWEPYEFPWKPGRLDRRPGFVAPWQPRLDWQMWFASLGTCGNNPWVLTLQLRLLEERPEVLALFASAPEHPKYLRTTSYEYRFAPAGSPDWWVRTEVGPYCPMVMIGADGRLQRAVVR